MEGICWMRGLCSETLAIAMGSRTPVPEWSPQSGPPDASGGAAPRPTVPPDAWRPEHDPLWQAAPAPITARYQVMGIDVCIAANSHRLADAAERAFGYWRAHETDHPDGCLQVNLFVHEAPEPVTGEGRAPLYRRQRGYFLLTMGGTVAFADRAGRFATAFVTPALAADAEAVQEMIVECLVLYLLGDFGRVPLHAGAVVHRGRCAVLAGPGGAGKSTLVYACARAGLGVVAEDSIHVEPGGDDVRVRGNPFHLHLLPDAPRFFPELRGMSLTKRSSGKTKMRIDLGARFPGRCVPSARVAGVLTVGRAPSTGSRIVTEDRASVVDALMPRLVHQASGDASAARHAAERVAGASFARLEVGADPSGAVALIQQWLEDRPQGSCRQTSGARK